MCRRLEKEAEAGYLSFINRCFLHSAEKKAAEAQKEKRKLARGLSKYTMSVMGHTFDLKG